MTIYDIVRKMQMLINSPTMSIVDRANLTSHLIKEFENNFKIVPKEEYGVIYNSQDAGRMVTGGFSSEKEAKRFASKWNEKQEEYIESILATNPESDISCETYLTVGKIEPVKKEYLDWWKYDHELKENDGEKVQ